MTRLALSVAELIAAAFSGAVAVLYIVPIVRGDVVGPPDREWQVALVLAVRRLA